MHVVWVDAPQQCAWWGKQMVQKKKVDILVSWEEWVVCLWQMLFCYLNKTFFSVGLFLGGCGRVIVQTFCDGDLCWVDWHFHFSFNDLDLMSWSQGYQQSKTLKSCILFWRVKFWYKLDVRIAYKVMRLPWHHRLAFSRGIIIVMFWLAEVVGWLTAQAPPYPLSRLWSVTVRKIGELCV